MVPDGHKKATGRPSVAKALYRRWQKEIAAQDDSRSLTELLDEWQGYRNSLGYSKQAGRNRRVLDSLIAWAKASDPDALTASLLHAWTQYLHRLGDAPKTIKNKLGSVSGFLRWLEEQDVIDKRPVVSAPKVARKLPRYILEKDYDQVLAKAEEIGCWLEVLIALKTGVRLSELRLLAWEDMLFEQRVLVLPKTKSNRPRTIPLHSDLLDALRPLAGEGAVFPGRRYSGCSGYREVHTFIDRVRPLTKAFPQYFHKGLGQRATGRAFHTFRHTFGVRAAKAGVPLPLLKEWMGHVDIATTMIYASFSPEKYSAEIERV